MRVGLTGGIGAGKSLVSVLLAERGAVVIDYDLLAREVVEVGTPALAAIVERFGTGVLLPDGTLDRPALGAVVFGDDDARRDLEAITHPAIGALAWERDGAAPDGAVVVHDHPLLVETGLAELMDLVVVVDAPEEAQLDRLTRLRRMSEADARLTHRRPGDEGGPDCRGRRCHRQLRARSRTSYPRSTSSGLA